MPCTTASFSSGVPTSAQVPVNPVATCVGTRVIPSDTAARVAITSMARQFMALSFRQFAKLLGTRAIRVAHVLICGCRRHPHRSLRSVLRFHLCLPMAPGLPIGGSGDFGTSPFLGSSRASHYLRVPMYLGYRDQSTMARREFNSQLRMPRSLWFAVGSGMMEGD